MIERIRAAFAAFFVAGTIVAAAPASAAPAICVMPTTGTVSGLTLVQDINNCFGAALALFEGGTAPASPATGMLWWNTGTGWVQQWDGAAWLNLWAVDPTNHLIYPQVGGGLVGLASAATTDLCSNPANHIQISGSATITSFGSSCALGQWKSFFINGGTPTLVASGNLILPNGGSNIAAASGDTGIAAYLGSGVWVVKSYQRASGAALSSVGLSVGSSALAQSAQGFEAPINLQLAAAVAGNNLTVTVLGVNGSNPASTNPVLVNFRSTTLNNGSNGVVYGQITAPLSFQVTSGNTMGCTTGVVCRLWVTLICRTESSGNCTDIRVGLSDQSTATQVFPLAEDVLQTTGAGTQGGGTAGIIQTNIASLSGVAIRIAGYIEVTWHSGTGWDTTPSKVQLFGPGVHKPGDLVQTVYYSSSSGGTTSSGSPGVAWSSSITPTSAINLVAINATVSGFTSSTTSSQVISQIYRGSTPLWAALQIGDANVNGEILGSNTFNLLDNPGATSTQTYNVEIFRGGAGTITFSAVTIMLQEIMGALDEPANDDGLPLRLVG